MSNQHKKNIEWLFFLLAIVLIGFLSLLFIETEKFLGIETKSHLLDLLLQVTPDLIAALIIFIFIYWFLTRKGIDSKNQIKEDIIEHITEGVKSNISAENIKRLAFELDSLNNTKILGSKDSREIFQFEAKLKTAKEIWMNGYSCRHFLGQNRQKIEEAIRRGTNFRLIIMNKNSKASEMMNERTVKKNLLNEDIETTLDLIKEINKNTKNENKGKGTIEIRYTKWIPSCSMLIFNPNEKNGEIKVNVYPPFHSTSKSIDSVNFVLTKSRKNHLFEYYLDQFNRLWNRDSESEIGLEISSSQGDDR